MGGKGRHFHVAFVYRWGERVVVVVYSKRKWRVSLRNSTKNRHLFLLFFSFSFFISRHLVILPFVSVSLIAQLFLVFRELFRFANQTAVSICFYFHLLLCFSNNTSMTASNRRPMLRPSSPARVPMGLMTTRSPMPKIFLPLT